MRKRFFIVPLGGALVAGFLLLQPAPFPDRMMVAYDPQQFPLPQSQSIAHDRYEITAVARYTGQALVLSKKRYFWGKGADLAPVDLALGWGPMSDGRVLKEIRIIQAGRFYWWWTRRFPIPRREIETHSANVHIIAADKDIQRQVNRIRKGDVIRFKGYLVNVQDHKRFTWRTSLSRSDTGYGACEIIWVDEVERLGYDESQKAIL